MSSWSRNLALVLAFAVMPLHGIAATVSALLCHGDAHAHAMHEPGGQDHDGHHGAHNDDGGANGTAAYHLCCNVTVSVPSAVAAPPALPVFPVRAFAPDPLHDLYIPDRPQRPPLA